jgi:RNA polymerase sigma-70 factor (ECF subfamily)
VREPRRSLQPTVDSSRSFAERELGTHRPWLERAARGLGFSPVDAEDLAQAVAWTFLEVSPRFERRSSARTFLFGILRRKAAELRRSTKRHAPSDTTLDHVASDAVDGEARFEAAHLGRVIDECIGELPPKQRGAVELRFLRERGTEDAGRELGVSANYFGVLLNRARAHLRHCISSHGF